MLLGRWWNSRHNEVVKYPKYQISNIPLSLSFPRSFDHSGFCRVNFRFFETNFWCRHYVTLTRPRFVPVRRAMAKAFIWRKVVPLARGTLPIDWGETTRPKLVTSVLKFCRRKRSLQCASPKCPKNAFLQKAPGNNRLNYLFALCLLFLFYTSFLFMLK